MIILYILYRNQSYNNESGHNKDKIFRKVSDDLNKTFPQNVDKYTVIQSSMYHNGEFIYSYKGDFESLTNDFNISKYEWEQNQYNSLRNTVCTSPDFKSFRDYDIDIIWSYVNLDGKYFSEVKVETKKCP